MKKIIMVLMLLALSVATFSCGGGSGSSSSPKGENPGLPSVVQLRSSHDVAQTNATVYLHARILDGNGVPVRNERVTFTNLSEPFGVIKAVLNVLGLRKPIGVLSAPVVKTNNLGIATVKLTSTTSGFATIQAEVNSGAGQVRDKRTIFFGDISGPVATPDPTLDLSVDDGNGTFDQNDDFNLFKGGSAADNQRTIRATVLNGSGVPLQGVTVTFGSDSPDEVTFTPALQSAITNANGEAFILVTVKPSILTNLQRVLNITAQATVDGTNLADVVSLFLQPVTVTSVTVTANPDRVAPGGTSTIVASVKMLQSLPVPDGSSVSFETTCGSVTPFGLTTDGVATATFTAPSVPPSGPCTVTASIGGVSGTVNITVTTTLTVQPSSQTINGITGGTATYTIFGGAAPYIVFSNDTAFPAVVAGNIFTVNVSPNSAPKTVTYTVRDSLGVSVTASLVIAGGTSLAVLPSAVTADSAAPEDTILFTIFGGVPPYSVFSNNPGLFPPSTPTVAASGGTFTVVVPVGAANQSVVMTIRDSGNPAATVTANITITAVAPQALRVIPTTRTIGNPVVGNTASFSVTGGQAPYKAFSNNPLLATVPEDAAGNTVTATVAGVPTTDTTVTITIFDSLGTSVNASLILDIAPVLPMSVIPTTQTLSNPAIGNTAQYQVLGGTGGYLVFSNNPALATASVAGNIVTATVQSVPSADTTVTFSIFDSAGSSTSASLILDIAPILPMSVIPTTQMLSNPSVGNTAQYQVLGGTGSYTVFSNNPTLVTAAVAGNVVTATVQSIPSADTTVTLTIYDSVGASVNASLVLDILPVVPLAVIPSSQTKSNPAVGNTVQYQILGGTGGYSVFSNNPALVTASVAGNIVTATVQDIPSADTTITLTIFDSAASSTTASLVLDVGPTTPLNVLPATIALTGLAGAGDSVTFSISGGSGTYVSVVSNNTAVIPNPIIAGNQFTIDPTVVSASTSVTLTVRDSEGATDTVAVTVTPATSSMSVNPSAISVTEGATITFNIIGGAPQYAIYSSNTSILHVVGAVDPNPLVTGNTTFTVHAISTGNATITIVDSGARTITATVTVNALTGPDNVAPLVLFTIPVGGASGVPVDADITIRFNEAMDAATISGATITMFDDTAGLVFSPGCFTYSPATFTATIPLSGACADLAAGNDYTVTVSTNVRDVAGNQLAAPFAFSFTTAP